MFDENNLIELLKLEIHNCEKQGHSYIGMDLAAAKQIMELLKQRKTDWIPVKERLPEEPEQNPKLDDRPMELYLVDNGEDYPFRAFWNGKYFHDGWRRLDVLAWMPLPERYEEKEND